jgi:peptidylprolyl isomerase
VPAQKRKGNSRQWVSTQARIAAAEAARRKAQRRQRLLIGGGGAVVAILLLAFALTREGKSKVDTASTTTTPSTSSPAADSAAGKPCVATADPLPAGAPAVPVVVGPPPAQLVKQDLVTGSGAVVQATDTITVNYIGVSCSTGKIFDSSYSRNQPATFPLSDVIKGWTDGIPGMQVGGQRLLGIPPDQAYGPSGSPPKIAPDETLWFVVEVLDAKPA